MHSTLYHSPVETISMLTMACAEDHPVLRNYVETVLTRTLQYLVDPSRHFFAHNQMGTTLPDDSGLFIDLMLMEFAPATDVLTELK